MHRSPPRTTTSRRPPAAFWSLPATGRLTTTTLRNGSSVTTASDYGWTADDEGSESILGWLFRRDEKVYRFPVAHSFSSAPPHRVMDFQELISRFGLALGIGLLFGLERGWRMRGEPPGGRTAGIRTFAISGILGGVVGATAQTIDGVGSGIVLGLGIAAFSVGLAASKRSLICSQVNAVWAWEIVHHSPTKNQA